MLKSSLCDYSDAYILISGAITVQWDYNSPRSSTGGGNNNIQVVFKNCAPFTDCMRAINNTQKDNAKDI